jgi:hypothetical protein
MAISSIAEYKTIRLKDRHLQSSSWTRNRAWKDDTPCTGGVMTLRTLSVVRGLVLINEEETCGHEENRKNDGDGQAPNQGLG